MSQGFYDRVYAWKPETEEWQEIRTVSDAQAYAVRTQLRNRGIVAQLGLSTIGVPKGSPSAAALRVAEIAKEMASR